MAAFTRTVNDSANTTDFLSVTYTTNGERKQPTTTAARHTPMPLDPRQWLYRNATSNRVGRPSLAPRKESL